MAVRRNYKEAGRGGKVFVFINSPEAPAVVKLLLEAVNSGDPSGVCSEAAIVDEAIATDVAKNMVVKKSMYVSVAMQYYASSNGIDMTASLSPGVPKWFMKSGGATWRDACNSAAQHLSFVHTLDQFQPRSIMNWASEFLEDGCDFKLSKVGKHQRMNVFDFDDEAARAAQAWGRSNLTTLSAISFQKYMKTRCFPELAGKGRRRSRWRGRRSFS